MQTMLSPRTRRDLALRMVLGAWLADDATLGPDVRDWLAHHLAERAWVPTARDLAVLRPGLTAWATQHGYEPLLLEMCL